MRKKIFEYIRILLGQPRDFNVYTPAEAEPPSNSTGGLDALEASVENLLYTSFLAKFEAWSLGDEVIRTDMTKREKTAEKKRAAKYREIYQYLTVTRPNLLSLIDAIFEKNISANADEARPILNELDTNDDKMLRAIVHYRKYLVLDE